MLRAIGNCLILWIYAFAMMVGFMYLFVAIPFKLIFSPKVYMVTTEEKLVKINLFLSEFTAHLNGYIDTFWK
jgi:hypothetical protein